MPGKCKFNPLWLDDVRFKDWISEHDNPAKAKCRYCPKTREKPIDISSMGMSALLSHMDGKKTFR